jgi:hypothetical protein
MQLRKKYDHPKLAIVVHEENGKKWFDSYIIGNRIYTYHPTKGWRNRNLQNVLISLPVRKRNYGLRKVS